MQGSTKALSNQKWTTKAFAISNPVCSVILACAVWPALIVALAVPAMDCGSVTTALAVYFPGGIFSSVQELFERLVRVRVSDVPSSCVPSTLTVTLLKSKPGWPSTVTSTTNVPVSTDGCGGGCGGGGTGSGAGGGTNSRNVKAYSNRAGLPASSRKPISSMSTFSTCVAVAISATKETGAAARNFSCKVFNP